MPRKRHKIRSRQVHLYIPEDLIARIETIFWDPVRERSIYGSNSYLVTKLLEYWLKHPEIVPMNIEALRDLDIRAILGSDEDSSIPLPPGLHESY